jgi:hypothetical protein
VSNHKAGDWIYTLTQVKTVRRLLIILKLFFYLLAFLSIIYTVVTAAEGNGFDLGIFQGMGQAWVDGVYQSNVIPGLPPYTVVLFAPLSLVSYSHLRIIWLLLNLATAGLSVYLAIKLFGEKWCVEACFFLAAFLLTWAPFRVNVRNGQISLMITALLLGSLLARKRGRKLLAGILLGFALCKYPLSYGMFLYFVWRKEWKIIGAAILIPAALTLIFAFRLDMSPVEVICDYMQLMSRTFANGYSAFTGVTEIKPLLYTLVGQNESLASILTILLSSVGLVSMFVVFRRRPQEEDAHYAAITFFTLWSVYHRVYDSVLCLLPAAVLVGLLVQRRNVVFSLIGLAALGLLVVSIPGLLTVRLDLSAERLSESPLGLLGLHIERLLMVGMFCSFLILLWKKPSTDQKTGLALTQPESGV